MKQQSGQHQNHYTSKMWQRGFRKKQFAAFTLAEGGRKPLLNLCSRKCALKCHPELGSGSITKGRRAAFTLAEVLITLAIIGIVAALTIPALVKNHNERAWSTAQDLFTKKLEVAMRSMNTDGKLSGHATTEDFVNGLKKYIKINKVCTDDITKCFSKEIVWREGVDPIPLDDKAVFYSTNAGQDWAETVGVQFSNGVTALLAYNKNCYVEPYSNQVAATASCVGMIYDVTGNKKPNTNGKDLLANANVDKVKDVSGCAYVLSDGTCFSKILGPNMGYTKLSNAECIQAKADGKIDVDYCYDGDDYYAGAVLACGGKKNNLPSQHQLALLATDLYNYNVGDGELICASCTNSGYTKVPGFSLDTEKASAFLAQSPGQSSGWFGVWSSTNAGSDTAYKRFCNLAGTSWDSNYGRYDGGLLAVCLGD